MSSRGLGALALAAAIFFAGPAVASADTAVGMRPYEGIRPETWLRDVEQALAPAFGDLERRAAGNRSGQLAIVLDVEGTALATDFAIDPDNPPATAPVLKYASKAAGMGVRVFFVTNATTVPGSQGADAKRQLLAAGFPIYSVYSRPSADPRSKKDVKAALRTEIEKAGFTIVANVGNAWADLDGGHAEKVYKLPDYDGLLR